jgi:hypothetical protein
MVFVLKLTPLAASCQDHRLIPYKVYNKFPYGSQFVSKPDMPKTDISALLCQYNTKSLKKPIGIIFDRPMVSQ